MDPQPAQLQDQALLSAFHQYPWQTDLAFLKGLIALLGGVEKLRPDPAHADLTLHARIFYYRKVREVQIDFSSYQQWAAAATSASRAVDQDLLSALYWAHDTVAAIPGPLSPNLVHAVAAIAQHHTPPAPETTSGPAWQLAAPRLELRVSREPGPEPVEGDGTNAAPYPTHFAELIAAVRANKPVPGVREIPDTVVRTPDVKPIGSMIAPKKPWEANAGDISRPGEVFLYDAGLGCSFPPLDHESLVSEHIESKDSGGHPDETTP